MKADRISKMSKDDIIDFIDDIMFDFDNSVQDIADFDKDSNSGCITWTLHNGRVIQVLVKTNDARLKDK